MSTNSVPGTNVPPISFPGIVSGIDYNAIISKLTSLSLVPAQALNASIATLNNANTELIKINNLLVSVQNSLQNLSNPSLYNAFGATSSSPDVATATSTPGVAAIPGVYSITNVVTATATTVVGSATAGHSITDVMTAGPYAGQHSDAVPLASSYAAVTPTNGGNLGQVTIDGLTISYNVNTQSLDQILNNINTAVKTVDPQFSATLAGGAVHFTSTDAPISLGSSSDQGNLLDVLKLSNAQVNNTVNSGSVVGTGDVGGINPNSTFGTITNAGYATAVTGGFFTINGTKITVSTGDNTNDVVNRINAAGAGVVATVNSATGQIVLTALQTGPQGIVLGAAGDTSNFLTAAGLKAAAGGTTTLGTQSEVDVQAPGGGVQKYFSNSNSVTSAIPGITLNLVSSSNLPFTVTVSQSTDGLTGSIQSFVTAYNAAISEINNATAAPIVVPPAPGSGGQSKSVGGGVLFGNTDAQNIVQRLTQLVSGFLGSGNKYNSLSQLGLQISDSFSQLTATNNGEGNTSGANSGNTNLTGQTVQSTSMQGTDGTLQPLDLTKFAAAFTANQAAVGSLLNGSNGLTSVLGSYLSSVTGTLTLLNSGPAGTVPTVSVIQNYENSNTDALQSLQQRVNEITDAANLQADNLRNQFIASETLIAQLQNEQQQLAAALGFTLTSNSTTGGSKG
jgi:flagellar hook-associated protein 2